MLTQEHVQTAREFLDAADDEFAAGDVLQASEKMWGAASHAVMAIAQQRGWPYGSHRALSNAVRQLAEEQPDESLRSEFSTAEGFHANFYHGYLEDFQIEDYRVIIRRFVNRMLALAV